jgi:cyclic beta-1,2-glucan synthetase
MVDATEVPLDMSWLEQFTAAYQRSHVLNIGELWALPTLLRLVILHKLCESAEQLVGINADASEPCLECGDILAGCVLTLNAIAHYQWRECVERLSHVDKILARDPVQAYASMDFKTRDSYRDAVEALSRCCECSEVTVAESAIYLASTTFDQNQLKRHVGYFLVGPGHAELQRQLGHAPTPTERFASLLPGKAALIYVSGIAGSSALLLAFLHSWLQTATSPSRVLTIIALALPPALMICSSTINWVIMRCRIPRVLPKMDFETGISADWKTAVAIPVLLTSADELQEILAGIETNYLGNNDPLLHYILLSDFPDAPEPELPGEPALLALAGQRIDDLNQRYGNDKYRPFYLMHRRRLWNESEGCWMGWERKRGKLAELNQFLLEGTEGAFTHIEGERDNLCNIQFVICLDADTHLTAGSARKMVATLAHPLNRPVFDSDSGRVQTGYTIIQPRLEINPVGANSTLFSRIFTGDVTFDLYTRAVSNVYQDMLNEGIFVGKGIYDLKGFTTSIEGQFPENSILSHDLLEGVHGRTALASDIVLFEDFPATLLAYMRRQHRWIRGDWQLCPWIGWSGARVGPHRARFRARLIDRWKILDNLSRSLLSPCLLALLIVGWLWLPELAWQWSIGVALLPGLPILLETLAALRPSTWRWGTIGSTLGGHGKTILIEASRWVLILAFLPYQSLVAVDAIVRTLFRLLFRRKHLLEWTSAAQIARQLGHDFGALNTFKHMSPAVIFALASGTLVFLAAPDALIGALPFLLVWCCVPLIAWWVSQAYKPVAVPLTDNQTFALRLLARRTWHFFESFINPENQWLPPDNVQQTPKFVVAQRTSPSNIGFAMLSTLSAYDFGYLGLNDLCARLNNTLQTLRRVPKYRGHYLNWIKTTDLTPLDPHYISTVDSGNLAGCLITLTQGLKELRNNVVPSPRLRAGMHDTLGIMLGLVEQSVHGGDLAMLKKALDELHNLAHEDKSSWWTHLTQLEAEGCKRIEDEFLATLEQPDAHWSAEDIAEFRGWIRCLRNEIHAAQREHKQLAPWQSLLLEPPQLYQQSDELGAAFAELRERLEQPLTLNEVAKPHHPILAAIDKMDELLDEPVVDIRQQAAMRWNTKLRASLDHAALHAHQILNNVAELCTEMREIVDNIDFRFLYDAKRDLFHIGYNASSGELDTSYYDLLASEARLASFVAIAQRQVPTAHWLHLGRPLTRIRTAHVLLSWSATLFEYLMPNLLMECPNRTLMNQSSRTAVDLARRYGKKNDVPWGISESGYYRFDQNGNYQYQAFGLPQLGLSRTHSQRLVIAPYASVLALPYARSAVVENLEELRKLGMEDQFGMREALDYGLTSQFRPNLGGKPVASYMSHHQGMIMLALGNALMDNPMVRRFHADPRIASIEPLLYEAVPQVSPTFTTHLHGLETEDDAPHPHIARTWKASTSQPAVNVLSNSHLHTRITSDGGGGQYWNDIALTRWESQADGTIGGLNMYFKDLHSGAAWSLGAEHKDSQQLDVEFGPHMAIFLQRKQELLTRMSIVVAPDADIEIRKLVITSEASRARSLFVALAAEPIMTRYDEFRRHPAFSRLFIESEFIAESGILMFRRRPRDSDQEKLYVGYALVTNSAATTDLYSENDRGAFLGRCGDAHRPDAITGDAPTLTGVGDTPNPWMALGTTIEIPAHDTVQLTFLTAVGNSQRKVLDTIAHFQSEERISWSMSQARVHSEYGLQQANLGPDDARTAMEVLARVFWPETPFGEKLSALKNCTESQQSLWRYGISGDHPIVIMSLGKSEQLTSAAQLLRCHTYWNLRGIAIDLVFLDETSLSYSQPVRDRLRNLIEQSQEHHLPFEGITSVISASNLSQQDRDDLIATASVYLRSGTNISGLLRPRLQRLQLPPFVAVPSSRLQETHTEPVPQPKDLLFNNGYGGFSKDGREYIMYQTLGDGPPAPWVNILANEGFGCLTTSAGLDFTWRDNSSEYRLTQWHNDPVTEQSSEALYLRDEETAAIWSPTPLPANDGMPYLVAHGTGYTRFEHNSNGLNQRITVFVDPDEPVKVIQVRLQNLWSRNRRLTLTYAVEWVLGNSHADNAGLLIPEMDADTHAILIRNGFARHHSNRVGFMAASASPHSVTTDLAEFLGKNRSWREPAGLRAIGLSDHVAPGQEIATAYQVHVDLEGHATTELHFILGAGEQRDEALERVRRFQNATFVIDRRNMLDDKWDDILGQLQIETPDPAINLLTNRWLLYQVISSRLWGRTGFYQPGGAFGFRDQLQDVLALLETQPKFALEQIIRSAAVQFEEGDVLHWWHEDPLRGVRTRCSDDLLWLPYAVAEYLRVTGDDDLLNQQVAWLDGAQLEAEEDERYAEFAPSQRSASIYKHCCHAIDARATVGAHGLPFIGSGDWNDGLNRVGADGRGESVWMAWFLCFVLDHFAPVCERQGDPERADYYRLRSKKLARAANENGWDGSWYLRGFYDDGDELGGKESDECKIDLNAQTWAGISGAGDPEKFRQGMHAILNKLVDPEHELIKLLSPPFQKTAKDPGYIKGYPPGVRENGGQYNHAAVWAAWAMAQTGDADTLLQWCQWMNPVYRAADKKSADLYRIEPYVMAGDISAGSANAGRGGWSWYSGSAAWYYRLIVEQLLGLKWSADGLHLAPCVPADWPEFRLRLQHRDTTYAITVSQPALLQSGNTEVLVAGETRLDNGFAWANDGQHHKIIVRPPQKQRCASKKAAVD